MTTVGMTCKVRLTYLPSNDGILRRDGDKVPGHQAG